MPAWPSRSARRPQRNLPASSSSAVSAAEFVTHQAARIVQWIGAEAREHGGNRFGADAERDGGNLDDPNLVAGTTVYFPVFVPGGLFSIGDPHAVQGHGEVSGTPIDEAAKKATRYMFVEAEPKG